MLEEAVRLNKIYENNKKILKDKYEKIYKELTEWEKTSCDDVIVEYKEQLLIGKKKDGKTYYLNSRYNQDEFVNRWIENNSEVKDYQLYIVYGISDFRCIKKLVDILKNSNILLIYEPDKSIFFEAIKYVDISEILNKDSILLVVGEINWELFVEFTEYAIVYATVSLIKNLCMPNYNILYNEMYSKIMDVIKNRVRKIIMDRNTNLVSRKGSIENELYSVSDLKNQYSVNQIMDICRKKCDFDKVPAIIVSAGPSLNKNIDVLKKAEKKSVIIAVDSAVRTVLSHGIMPDLVISIDWEKPPILFMNSKFFDSPMVIFDYSNKKISEIHQGKRFYFSYKGLCVYDFYKKIKEKNIISLETGGSVANNAYSLALFLGFKNIILIGQDLAYTNNEMHSKEAYGGIDYDKALDTSGLTEVEDVFGGKVYAPYDMEAYRRWFENQIMRYEGITTIDATEGGAKINGSKIMTLSDAIDEYCKGEFDLTSEINKLECVFSDKEKEAYSELEENIDSDLEQWKKDLRSLLRKYDRLLELSRKSKKNTKEYRTLVNEIGKKSKKIEENGILGLAIKYNKLDEYDVLRKVYDIKDDKQDEVKEIVHNGKRMIEAYLNGIDELKKDILYYTTFQKEEFSNIMNIIDGESQELRKCRSEEDINQLMKDMYGSLVDAINMISKLKTDNINEKKQHIKDELRKIVLLHEEHKYEEMAECIEKEFLSICKEALLIAEKK